MLAYLVPGSAARPAVVDMHTRSWCAVASLPPHSPHMFAFAHVPPSCRAQDLGYLVTKRKLEDDDNFEDWVNHHSKVGCTVWWSGPCGVCQRWSCGSCGCWAAACFQAWASRHSKVGAGRVDHLVG